MFCNGLFAEESTSTRGDGTGPHICFLGRLFRALREIVQRLLFIVRSWLSSVTRFHTTIRVGVYLQYIPFNSMFFVHRAVVGIVGDCFVFIDRGCFVSLTMDCVVVTEPFDLTSLLEGARSPF